MSEREQQLREKRAEFLQLAETHAERRLNDRRWNWLRTPANRKRLVVVTFAVLLIYGFANYLDQPVVALLGIVGFFVLLFAMQTASRAIPDMPDELVDERMRAVRGTVYRHAYVGSICLYSAVIVLDISLALAAKLGAPVTRLNAEQWFDLLFVAFFATMAIPSAIYLWTEPEL
ncbi:MAG: hypothetical protein AAGC71_14050 [Pseudomonadota bacterium]